MYACVSVFVLMLIVETYYFDEIDIKNKIQQEMPTNVVLKINKNNCRKVSSVMLIPDRHINHFFEGQFMVVKKGFCQYAVRPY